MDASDQSHSRSRVRALIGLAQLDPLYADRYLLRAEAFVERLCPPSLYARVRERQRRLPLLAADLRRAAEEGEWAIAQRLAQEGAEIREDLSANANALLDAEVVYEPRRVQVDSTALGLAGVIVVGSDEIERARVHVVEALELLLQEDPEWSPLYARRREHFKALSVSRSTPARGADPSALQKALVEAAHGADFGRARRLADALAAIATGPSGRMRVSAPPPSRIERLDARFSKPTLDAARGGGLAEASVPTAGPLNAYLRCGCGDEPDFPHAPLSETHRTADACTCGHPCPPDIPPDLRSNLDLLLLHPFATSAGTRYLPWFGAETVLVETFSEGNAGNHGEMLELLHLSRRRGLSREMIEDAVLRHGSAVCRQLHLDPDEFIVTCIPFDVYLRLAPVHGWGKEQAWTHFDGYQITRELHLRALVGGDVRYGGPHDLCAVDRSYDAERLVARFAVVRRDRLALRAAS